MDKSFSFSNRHIDWMERDAKSVYGWRYLPRIIFERGKGVTITDVDGNDYYDMTGGMMCMVLGHAHPEVTETIREQADRLIHESSWYSNPWAIEFAELILSTLPKKFEIVNFAVTGSEANEIAMRMAIGVTGKFDIVSAVHGLHGGSLAAEAVTSVGGARKQGLGPLLIPARSNCLIPPFTYRAPVKDTTDWDEVCLKLSEELIAQTTSRAVAGILIETMLVAGGMIVPTERWMRGVREIADRWGAVLIFDEAQLAPGRTGKLWGFEHYDVLPDIITFAKGMSAGLPICGTITTREIAEQCRGNLGLPWSGTYPADPLPAAVALKSLQIVLRDGLTERAAKLGATLRAKLDRIKEQYACVGDVRGRALYQMLDIVTDPETRTPDYAMAERIRYNAALEGVILICVKNFLRLCPALVITEAELDDVIGRLETAIRRAVEGHPKDIDFSTSSSLAATQSPRRSAAE